MHRQKLEIRDRIGQHKVNRRAKRAVTFRAVYERLLARKPRDITVVETGCLRSAGNWAGDGQSTLKQLILSDSRAVCTSAAYLSRHPDASTRVPVAGETVRLVELGSHCRGAIFVDGMHYCTSALEQRIDEISKAHAGFYFGRYDIRAASLQEFQAGRFQVIELNGVAAEPAHIYDPRVSLRDAYAALARHWKLAFEIGAANRKLGAAPLSTGELLRLGYEHRQLVPVQEQHRG